MRTRLTPAIVIIASALVTASIIAGELVLLAKWDKVAATFGLPQLSTTTMADGSVLTLHSVTYGKSHLLNVPVGTQGLQLGGRPANVVPANLATGSNRLVFFVSRHDPETKEFLDFDSWSHCKLTDAFGEQVQDDHPHRFAYSTRSSSSQGRDRGPFPRLPANDPNMPRGERRILLGLRLQPCRLPENPTLDFFDTAGNKIASLPFVSPIPVPATEWKPDVLPATREVTQARDPASGTGREFQEWRDLQQPVSLTLKGLELTSRSSSRSNGNVHQYRPLKFDADLLVNGQTSNKWQLSTGNLTDALGNEATFGDVTLSVHEPVWRVTFMATRTLDAEFAEHERRVLTGLSMPDYGVVNSDTVSLRADGFGIVPLALFGRGRGECQVAQAGLGSGRYRAGGSIRLSVGGKRPIGSERYSVSWQPVRYDGMVDLVKDSDLPCLFVLTNSLHPAVRLLARTVDSEGNEVPSHVRSFYDFAHLIFFEAYPRDGELTCEILMQTPVEFEFFVAPPEPKHIEN